MKIKALSLHQPWATYIADGKKTIETRTWCTDYRGDMLICSTKKPALKSFPCGMALAIVELRGCRRMLKRDEKAAMCPYAPGRWSWIIGNIRRIDTPFSVKGQQGLFELEIDYEGSL